MDLRVGDSIGWYRKIFVCWYYLRAFLLNFKVKVCSSFAVIEIKIAEELDDDEGDDGIDLLLLIH
jgi:hypothetical protein